MKRYLVLVIAVLLSWSVSVIAAEDYMLGAGDVVRISVYGQNDLATVARINESNRISFPLIGEVEIGGLTVANSERQIQTALEKGGFVKSPQVTINVEQFRSRQVSVLGEVNRPGKYPIDGPSKLIDLLAMAGGITREGGDVIYLTRKSTSNTETRQMFDLYGMLNLGNIKSNVDVKAGDIIFVPQMDRYYIYGEVARPGVYRLERQMTVMQALAVGGGITNKGNEKGIKIRRNGKNGQIDEFDASPGTSLQPDDVVYVKESLF